MRQATEPNDSIANLAEALAKAQADIVPAELDADNPFFKSKYASLASVMRAAKPIYRHGLSIVQMPSVVDGMVHLTTRLMHSSGEYIESTLTAPMGGAKNPIQAMGSTLSYLRRYSISSMLGIATGDDTDGNDETQQPRNDSSRGPRERSKRPAQTRLHRAQQTRNQHPPTAEIPRVNSGAPKVPTPKQKDNPRGWFFGVASKKGMSAEQQRCLLGYETRADDVVPKQRFEQCAQALGAWGDSELALVLDAVTATNDDDMKRAWSSLTGATKELITPACKARKQSLVDAGLWGILCEPDEGLGEKSCSCGATMWFGTTAKDKPVPLDRPIRRALDPYQDEKPQKMYMMGPDGKMHIMDTYNYREGENWAKGYVGHHITCPKSDEYKGGKAA